MRTAKRFGEDNNKCHSRKIGVVIIDPSGSRVQGIGYNSPPRNTPHCDSAEYLNDAFWPQLHKEDMDLIHSNLEKAGLIGPEGVTKEELKRIFVESATNCKVCPRRHVNAGAGQRLELCSCAHAETNAIVNSTESLLNSYMFAWCGVACQECTKLIINSHIKTCYFIDWGNDYSIGSRWLFKQAGVAVYTNPPEYYLEGQT